MKEPSRQPDRVIHDAIGGCLHDYQWSFDRNSELYIYMCVECGDEVHGVTINPGQRPDDYTEWENLGKVFEWMREDEGIFYEFDSWLFDTYHNGETRIAGGVLEMLATCDTSVMRDLIAEWIESTRE
jgi:hypothetical protein